MDPLSISASIIAVLTLAEKSIEYLNSVKDGKDDRNRMRSELYSVIGVLYALRSKDTQVQRDNPWFATSKILDGPSGPIAQFKTTLEHLVERLTPSDGWKKVTTAVAWPFRKGEVRELLDAIERSKTLFIFAQQNDHIALSEAIKYEVDNISTKVRDINVNLGHWQEEEKKEKIRRWLNPPDPSTNYNKALSDRFLGTGTWFLDSPIFTEWRNVPGSLLWLYGIPGCGKSILSSTIIEAVCNHCSSRPSSVALYFYFDFKSPEKQRRESLVKSLIAQLSSQSGQIAKALDMLYSSCMEGTSQPGYEALLSILHQMVVELKEVYIIIDALDECEERQHLLDTMHELASWKDVNLHTLTTSRREQVIEESMEDLTNEQERVSIQGVLVNNDIRAYVHGRLQTDTGFKRWRKEPLVQEEIEVKLISKAGGMFRWAACQLDSLRECINLSRLRTALETLPETLDKTYERILRNISGENYPFALKILQWLAYSAQSLRLDEIAELIAISTEETPRFVPEDRLPEPRDALMICGSLISLEDQPPSMIDKNYFRGENEYSRVIIQLAHFSVKEYLVSARILQGDAKGYSIQESEANLAIQNDCIAYLRQFDRPDSLTPQSLSESPLARYAAQYGVQHALVMEKCTSQDLCQTLKDFFVESDVFRNWVSLSLTDSFQQDFQKSYAQVGPPLYYACLVGLFKLVRYLLDRGDDVNARGEYQCSALTAALYEDNTILNLKSRQDMYEITQILIEKGADLNITDGGYDAPLQAASIMGLEQVIRLLLDNGADVNGIGGQYGTALIAASYLGFEPIVAMLLDNGAEVNIFAGKYGTALIAATVHDHDAIAQCLLRKGANVNAQVSRYGTALHAACENENEGLVDLLLERGAKVNVLPHGPNETPLSMASLQGAINIVRLLLDNGANVNLRTGLVKKTALEAASGSGNYQVVQTLLDYGAAVTVQALESALYGYWEDCEQVLQVLCDHGAGDLLQTLETEDKGLYDEITQKLREVEI